MQWVGLKSVDKIDQIGSLPDIHLPNYLRMFAEFFQHNCHALMVERRWIFIGGRAVPSSEGALDLRLVEDEAFFIEHPDDGSQRVRILGPVEINIHNLP